MVWLRVGALSGSVAVAAAAYGAHGGERGSGGGSRGCRGVPVRPSSAPRPPHRVPPQRSR